MVVILRRKRLAEMVRAVREKERQGFECVVPIRKIRNSKKIFLYDDRKERFSNFSEVSEHEYYFTKMRKVER
ncbi:MAG: hypothetical protein K6T39_01840 [Anoxybacillus ayderensis]|nr:hypothetical protein [Anoxybacillus ayderensis]